MLDKLSAKFVEEKAALEKAEAEKKTSHQLVMTSLKNQKTAASDVVCGSGIFVLFLWLLWTCGDYLWLFVLLLFFISNFSLKAIFPDWGEAKEEKTEFKSKAEQNLANAKADLEDSKSTLEEDTKYQKDLKVETLLVKVHLIWSTFLEILNTLHRFFSRFRFLLLILVPIIQSIVWSKVGFHFFLCVQSGHQGVQEQGHGVWNQSKASGRRVWDLLNIFFWI